MVESPFADRCHVQTSVISPATGSMRTVIVPHNRGETPVVAAGGGEQSEMCCENETCFQFQFLSSAAHCKTLPNGMTGTAEYNTYRCISFSSFLCGHYVHRCELREVNSAITTSGDTIITTTLASKSWRSLVRLTALMRRKATWKVPCTHVCGFYFFVETRVKTLSSPRDIYRQPRKRCEG